VDVAPAIEQHDLTLAHLLRLARAVGIGACLAKQDQREFRVAAHGDGRPVDELADIGGRHARFDLAIHKAVGRQGDVVGDLHQRQLGGRLDHPASAHDRIGADQFGVGQRVLKAVDREVAHGFLDADLALGEPALAQPAADQRERIFIFVPG